MKLRDAQTAKTYTYEKQKLSDSSGIECKVKISG